MSTFKSFRLLPPELRLVIWELAGTQPRILYQKTLNGRVEWHIIPAEAKIPSVLHACRESRAFWLSRYHTLFKQAGRITLMFPYVNYETDIFLIDSLTFPKTYFSGFDLMLIENLGWTKNYIQSHYLLCGCIAILPRLSSFSMFIIGKKNVENTFNNRVKSSLDLQ